jgi:hypothetical protein
MGWKLRTERKSEREVVGIRREVEGPKFRLKRARKYRKEDKREKSCVKGGGRNNTVLGRFLGYNAEISDNIGMNLKR